VHAQKSDLWRPIRLNDTEDAWHPSRPRQRHHEIERSFLLSPEASHTRAGRPDGDAKRALKQQLRGVAAIARARDRESQRARESQGEPERQTDGGWEPERGGGGCGLAGEGEEPLHEG
jgi:hypothetical protein